MATILVTHGIPAEGFSLLSGEKIVIPKPLMQFSQDELAALIPAADAVVACELPGEIIRRGTKLRIVANYGAGYDGVDVRAAAECGIPVTNLPDTVTDSGMMTCPPPRFAALATPWIQAVEGEAKTSPATAPSASPVPT